ncbi:MAG TPA: hypothetical protein VGB55_09900 [Tepidisphaeraceae bacterium]|jgi:hypothetical protein
MRIAAETLQMIESPPPRATPAARRAATDARVAPGNAGGPSLIPEPNARAPETCRVILESCGVILEPQCKSPESRRAILESCGETLETCRWIPELRAWFPESRRGVLETWRKNTPCHVQKSLFLLKNQQGATDGPHFSV